MLRWIWIGLARTTVVVGMIPGRMISGAAEAPTEEGEDSHVY